MVEGNRPRGPMAKRAILFALFAILMSVDAARPQDQLGIRMMQERIGDVRPGSYSAGDKLKFTLTHYLDRYLLHFLGESEIFVLTADHASLGGRVLKYDSGTTAL